MYWGWKWRSWETDDLLMHWRRGREESGGTQVSGWGSSVTGGVITDLVSSVPLGTRLCVGRGIREGIRRLNFDMSA